MRHGSISALASLATLVLVWGCATSDGPDAISDYELLVEACFEGAPTFASVDEVVSRAGGRPPEQLEWTNSTQLDLAWVVRAWDVSATNIPDKVALVAILEGQYEEHRARSCIGGQSVYVRPVLEDRLSERFDL